MGGGNGVAVPRLSKRFNVGMNCMEPWQKQLRDVSVNGASYPGKEECPIAQYSFSSQAHCQQVSSNHVDLLSTEILNPTPLCVIPAGKLLPGIPIMRYAPGRDSSCPQSDIANGSPELFPRPCLEQQKSIGSLTGAAVSIPSATRTEDASSTCTEAASNFQMALCPVVHDEHMEHDIASMLQIGYSASSTEGESADIPKNGKEIPAQNLPCLKKISDGDRCNVAEPYSQVMFPSREANARTVRERLRRAKISARIKALKSSVPCSGTSEKGDEDSVLDDAIDYIKYLKLQLKLLSQSRLSGESTTYPFVHLEGYGHYLLHQRVCNDPLEDMMGNLVEMNPQAANELLESKGLTVLPMDFAYTLLQTT